MAAIRVLRDGRALALWSVLLLAACGDDSECVPGSPGCICDESGGCEGGHVCLSNVCVVDETGPTDGAVGSGAGRGGASGTAGGQAGRGGAGDGGAGGTAGATAPTDAGMDADVAADACPADGCADAASDAATDAGDAAPDSGPLSAFCTPGSTSPVCDGAKMYLCSSEGAELGTLDCASDRLCQVGVALGECATCEPGAFRCDGTTLFACAEDGASWVEEDTCATAALCNTVAGACTAATCLPTNKRCVGDRLERCNGDQSGFMLDETCDPGLCDDVGDQCDVCTPGSTACVTGMLRTCNTDGQGYTSSACTQPSQQCQEATCPTGRTSCLTGDKDEDVACTQSGGHFCDGEGACAECNHDNQCSSGHCVNHDCVQCEAPSDCPGDDACNNPTCSAAGACGIQRLSGILCGSGQVCDNGTCETACGNGRVDAIAGEECEPGVGAYTWYTCDPSSCTTRTWYQHCNSDLECENSTCEIPSGLRMCLPPCPGNQTSTCILPPEVAAKNGTPNFFCAANRCAIGCDSDADCPNHLRCTYSGPVGACAFPP